jgi:hypothetical protein
MLNEIEPKVNSTERAGYDSSNEQLFGYGVDKPITLIIRVVIHIKSSENPVLESN